MKPHTDPHDPLIAHQSRSNRHAGSNGHNTRTAHSRSLVTPTDEELDALADLFLGPTEHELDDPEHAETLSAHAPSRPPAGTSSRRLSVEGVLVGHLPVSAAAWPGQYARTRTEQLGAPVAVIRLALGTLTIDLFGAESPDKPFPSESHALEAVRALTNTVILRVDEPTESRLISLPAVDRLSLLTGADDAAIVACYRKLKDISAIAESTGLPLPALHLTIMGGDHTKAAIAHQRIAGAAQAFLNADLLEPVIISRIGPTGSTSLYRKPSELSIEALCDLLTLPRPEAVSDIPTRDASRVAPAASSTPEPAAESAIRPETIAPEHASPAPAFTRAATSPGFPVSHTTAGESQPAMEALSAQPDTPKPISAQSTKHQPNATPQVDPSVPETLAALVAGLEPLDSRCPLTERIELATDEKGRLHLIAAVLTTQPDRSSTDPLSDLLRTAAWARRNADMLARVEPTLTVQTQQPGVHLITDRAALATSLLDTVIRVHLAVAAVPKAFGLTAAPLGE